MNLLFDIYFGVHWTIDLEHGNVNELLIPFEVSWMDIGVRFLASSAGVVGW